MSATIIGKRLFETIRIEKVIKGSYFKAKIIPYSVSESGEIFFLLSKEQAVGKNVENRPVKFNMLGGTCNENETILECAERELFEETIGIFDRSCIGLLKILPRENIIQFYRYYRQHFKGVVYLFFLPIDFQKMDFIMAEFARRKAILNKLYTMTPMKRADYAAIAEFINFPPTKRITKSELKHFNEISTIKWISEKDIFQNDEINKILRDKIRKFVDFELKEVLEYQKYREFLIQNKKLSNILSCQSEGLTPRDSSVSPPHDSRVSPPRDDAFL